MEFLRAIITQREFIQFLNELIENSKFNISQSALSSKLLFLGDINQIIDSHHVSLEFQNNDARQVIISVFIDGKVTFHTLAPISVEIMIATEFFGTTLFADYNKNNISMVDFVHKESTLINFIKEGEYWNISIEII